MKKSTRSPIGPHVAGMSSYSLCIEMMEVIQNARSEINFRMLRLPQVSEKMARANSTIWNDVRIGTLPAPIKMGRTVAWSEVELQACIDARMFASRTKTNVDIKLFVALLTAP